MATDPPPALGRIVASYAFDRRKTWPFMAMLVILMLLGVGRLASHGLEGELAAAFLLIGLPGLAFVMIGRELRIDGPVLLIGDAGLLDRRRGPEPVPWEAVLLAEPKRRPFTNGLRILLTSGERYDIDLQLLATDALAVLRLIQDQAGRATAGAHQGSWTMSE